MSYKAYCTYSNTLKNVRKKKSKFHTLKLIKLTNVRFYIEGFFLSFIVCYT